MAMARVDTAVWLLARRIMLRDGEPPRFAVNLMRVGALALVAGLVGGAIGLANDTSAGLWALLSFGLGAIAFVSAGLLRVFVPTVAVSAVGIAWGVASLFCVMAVTSGFELELLGRMGRLNGHVLVTKYGLDFFEWEAMSDELRRRPDVRGASPFVYGAVALQPLDTDTGDGSARGRLRDPAVVGVKGVDARRLGHFEGVGELFGTGSTGGIRPGQFHTRAPGVVIGDRLARRVGVQVGDSVRLVAAAEVNPSFDALAGEPRASVFEVTDTFHTGVSELDGTLVLIDLRAGMSLLYGEGRVTGIELQLEDPRDANPVAAAIVAQLNEAHFNPLFRTSTSAEGATPVVVIQNIRRIVSMVLSLIVLVAGSTLIGALLLIIRRRRRQIAILSAFGATRWTLFAVFEAAGVVAGLGGAVAGVGLGAVLCGALAAFRWPLDTEVYPLAKMPVAPQWVDAVLPALVAVGVCVLVAGPVAWHAARTRPIEALR